MHSGRGSDPKRPDLAKLRRQRRTSPSAETRSSIHKAAAAAESANPLAQQFRHQAAVLPLDISGTTTTTPRYLPSSSESSKVYDFSRLPTSNIFSKDSTTAPPRTEQNFPRGGSHTKNDTNDDDLDTRIPATTDPAEAPFPNVVITPLVSSQKRPIPVQHVDTNPPRLLLHRPTPLLAAAAHQKCLDGSATVLVERMGRPHEDWKILFCNGTKDEEDEILCYTTLVRLQNHRGEYLNITAVDQSRATNYDEIENDETITQRALLISASTTWDLQDPSTIWTLHPTTDPIPVGPTATTTISSQEAVPTTFDRRPVRMAEPFCLRNSEWNGILQSSTLQLLTDAHEQPNIVETQEFDDNHPMGRLWQVHSFLPSIQEIWYVQEPPDPEYRRHRGDHRGEHCNDEDNADILLLLDQTLFGHVLTEPQLPCFDGTTTIISVQETVLLDELLGACMGLSGDYIQFNGERYRLLQNTKTPWDTILHTTVTDLLEIPNAYKNVEASLRWQRHHDCPVRRALYDELQDWLDEYLDIILSQYRAFRNGKLSIHTLQALHGARKTLNIMVKICQLSLCGGALIRSLPKIPRLLQAVMVPYQEQLQAWLTQGRLIAPDYFMIQRNSSASTWDEKYVVHQDHVLPDLLPTFRVVQQTLATGRYWNAVRLCQTNQGVTENSDFDMLVSLTSFVERQHGEASEALKEQLLPDLRPSLQLIEDYFLMFKADTFLDFLEKATTELDKDIELISRHRIQHFFNEPKIQCFFRNFNNSNHPSKKGLDAFAIRLTNISFPSTIMLTRNVMLQYTSLFRHLFKVKFTEQKLLAVWKDHQLTKDLSTLALLTSTFALRHRMLHFVGNLEYYLRYEVIEGQWGKFLLDINKDSNTVDDMLEIQRRFLDNALEACMLKDRKARHALTVLIDTCIKFTLQMDYFHDATKLKVHDPSRRRVIAIDNSPPTADQCRERLEVAQELREQRRDIQSSSLQQGATDASYQSMVDLFSKAFDRRLSDFVRHLSTQHVSLYTRLNFNGFLSSDIDGATLNHGDGSTGG